MSLIGNLEDLGLGEILQIINLSRKSGVLTVRSEGRKAVLMFRSGQVVQAMSTVFHRGIGELLIRRGAIDEMTLLKAVDVVHTEGKKSLLGSTLIKRFGVAKQVVEEVVREQIERVVYSLFSWTEGTFDFELRPTVEIDDDMHLDPVQFMLRQGINPHQHAPISKQRVPEPTAPPAAAPAKPTASKAASALKAKDPALLLVIDDDAVSRETITEALKTEGYHPEGFARSEEALVSIESHYKSGNRPVLVVDLIMPRMDGSGILGGIELMELVKVNFPELKAVVVSDYHNNEAERKIRGMGYSFMLKPRKSEFIDNDIIDFFIKRLRDELATFKATYSPQTVSSVNLGDEIRREMGEAETHVPDRLEPSTGLPLLRGMLEELNEPALGGGVILLVLRFASEFMNRAVVFMVDDREIFALGQFGITSSNVMTADLVRELVIPRHEPSIFTSVLEAPTPSRVASTDTPWNRYLFEKMGGAPQEAFLGPILSEGKVVAILYGDNLPEERGIGDTETLEIFLSQAGMVMEKALLQRRLRERRQEKP
jgi:CheY-like chemotaxis protein